MSHSIQYDDDQHLIIISYKDRVTLHDIKTGASDVMEIAKIRNCFRVLIDSRKTKLPLSSMDIYKLPDILANVALTVGVDISRFKRAIVVNHKQADMLFMETVIQEHSQNAKIFDDIDAAKKWLSSM